MLTCRDAALTIRLVRIHSLSWNLLKCRWADRVHLFLFFSHLLMEFKATFVVLFTLKWYWFSFASDAYNINVEEVFRVRFGKFLLRLRLSVSLLYLVVKRFDKLLFFLRIQKNFWSCSRSFEGHLNRYNSLTFRHHLAGLLWFTCHSWLIKTWRILLFGKFHQLFISLGYLSAKLEHLGKLVLV